MPSEATGGLKIAALFQPPRRKRLCTTEVSQSRNALLLMEPEGKCRLVYCPSDMWRRV